MALQTPPAARTHMLIRRPVATVFEAFVDPAITSRFWFSRGSARLQAGCTVTWHWDMYGVSAEVSVPGGFEPEMPGISAWFLENPPGAPDAADGPL